MTGPGHSPQDRPARGREPTAKPLTRRIGGWAFAPRFDSCEYGPMALRHQLRRVLRAGELPMGWGTVRPEASPQREVLATAMAMVPAVGLASMFINGAVAFSRHRLFVITDHRLLSFRTDKRGARPGRAGAFREASLAELRVIIPRAKQPPPPNPVGVWNGSAQNAREQLPTRFIIESNPLFDHDLTGKHTVRVVHRAGTGSDRLIEALWTIAMAEHDDPEPQ